MKKEINIEGMSCAHCQRHVEQALKDVRGVTSVAVNLQEKKAIVGLNNDVDDSALNEAVEEAGYKITSIKNI